MTRPIAVAAIVVGIAVGAYAAFTGSPRVAVGGFAAAVVGFVLWIAGGLLGDRESDAGAQSIGHDPGRKRDGGDGSSGFAAGGGGSRDHDANGGGDGGGGDGGGNGGD